MMLKLKYLRSLKCVHSRVLHNELYDIEVNN